MKKYRLILMLALVVCQVTFFSCNKEEEEDINLLIGNWKYSEEIEDDIIDERILNFNADYSGSGQSYFLSENDTLNFDSYSFDYSIDENILIVTYRENNISNEIQFAIIENSLIINSYGQGLEYKKI